MPNKSKIINISSDQANASLHIKKNNKKIYWNIKFIYSHIKILVLHICINKIFCFSILSMNKQIAEGTHSGAVNIK